ncbi:hypothetical protein ANCDUO_00496 [Ancylostoma duodenale]|uniref:Uncharacterized protein n=1 Tax=Ancylostoma duodenale TaxID=51022 RepID=A0A0C2H5N4_9BILA|nr:hypothetical protein ANCDUO_00496 [Ancylostoma duodenale]
MRLNDHRWTRAVSDWTPRNVKRTTGRPPTRWKDVMLFVSLAQTEFIGRLWTSGRTAGARSVPPKINGSEGILSHIPTTASGTDVTILSIQQCN